MLKTGVNMFGFFEKKIEKETHMESYIEMLNSTFNNLYVMDIYTEIPLITSNGYAEQEQSVESFFSSISELAITIEKPYVDERFKLHIFFGGFYVFEINYQKRIFIVLGHSEYPINNLDDIKKNQDRVHSVLNQNSVLTMISTLSELKSLNIAYYEVLESYIYDNTYDYFINFLSKKRIDKKQDSDGFVYCELH
jgi:hypothetical protein